MPWPTPPCGVSDRKSTARRQPGRNRRIVWMGRTAMARTPRRPGTPRTGQSRPRRPPQPPADQYAAQTDHMVQIMSRAFGNERLVLDSPILPEVWLESVRHPGERIDVIVTPNDGIPSGPTAVFIRNRLGSGSQDSARVAYGRSTIS